MTALIILGAVAAYLTIGVLLTAAAVRWAGGENWVWLMFYVGLWPVALVLFGVALLASFARWLGER